MDKKPRGRPRTRIIKEKLPRGCPRTKEVKEKLPRGRPHKIKEIIDKNKYKLTYGGIETYHTSLSKIASHLNMSVPQIERIYYNLVKDKKNVEIKKII